MPLFCHLDSARLKTKNGGFLEKNKDQNLQVSEMFLIFALTFN